MNNSAAHTALVQQIRLALGREPDLILWPMQPGGFQDLSGRPMRCGPNGMADLCGILACDVALWTMPVQGRLLRLGRWFCLEVKTGRGVQSEAQRLWGDLVRRMGGCYVVVRSVDDAVAALKRARAGERE